MSQKHENYELLNLLGYGLAKFDNAFINEFDCKTKSEFFNFFVKNGIVQTASVVKNRMDLFDYFFPQNPRKGWWQKGDAYIHRKQLIDALFGDENVIGFANIVKLILKREYNINLTHKISPLLESKFKKMQNTGLEAELFFLQNYNEIELLQGGKLTDARLLGDGYDFFVETSKKEFLCEIKGIKRLSGGLRLTQNEFEKACEFKESYLLVAVLNLQNIPKFKSILNPLDNLKFKEKIITQKELKEYHLVGNLTL
ncbi:DUF3883 domain-containing protein [Campylobacter troglodytis]|uniref:DUF3883 domain-containing protein n=1 Tax=Campylobacter troglodytis TaxID=654363 RepID=UPI00115B82DE|nr:DUF3883 domain-containing protein [Campylobacter troglodytis]TQR51753.1 hypothetical protein DMC01_12650 [Campylobacter troglodytis]